MQRILTTLVLVLGLVTIAEAASPRAIQPADICPGAVVVDFETGTTSPPVVPGVTFVTSGTPLNPPWFDGGVVSTSVPPFGGVFGKQVYANELSVIDSDLAVQFSPATQAVGAYIGA